MDGEVGIELKTAKEILSAVDETIRSFKEGRNLSPFEAELLEDLMALRIKLNWHIAQAEVQP